MLGAINYRAAKDMHSVHCFVYKFRFKFVSETGQNRHGIGKTGAGLRLAMVTILSLVKCFYKKAVSTFTTNQHKKRCRMKNG